MPKVITLHELFVDMLRDIYYAEKKILRALPKMAKAVGNALHQIGFCLRS